MDWKQKLISILLLVVVALGLRAGIKAKLEEDIEHFLLRWKEIVETGDIEAYEKICSEEFKEQFAELYEQSREVIGTYEISVRLDRIEHRIRHDENRYTIRAIPVSFKKGDHQETFYPSLRIVRKSSFFVLKRWKIQKTNMGSHLKSS